MNHNFIILCFMAHYLGDYYIQSPDLDRIKDKKISVVIKHSLIYAIPYLFLGILLSEYTDLFDELLIIILLHFVITMAKYYYLVKNNNRSKRTFFTVKDSTLYIIDQSIHIVAIMILSYMNHNIEITPIPQIAAFFHHFNIETSQLLKWILLIITLNKPVNTSFKKIFADYKPSFRIFTILNKSDKILSAASVDDQHERMHTEAGIGVADKNAGQFIGFLERILISIFLSIGQYASIGFVMTAKSIARYDRISKSQEFAEYYLIGTLASLIVALFTYYFIFTFLK